MIYFNDNEPFVVPWLENLWPGATVDGRSVHDVAPEDVAGHTRAHFFAGIGGWEYALTLAEWPESYPVWTASLPCQPFSSAGKRLGSKDERHLWPVFRDLVEQCRPPVIFGEQVASSDGREWLGGQEGLRRVQDAQIIERLLQGQGFVGRLSQDVQSMHPKAGEGPKGLNPHSQEASRLQSMAEASPGEGLVDAREIQGQTEGDGVLPPRGGHLRCPRCGRLRTDRNSVQFRGRENLGQPVSGQDRLKQRLYAIQCACGAVLPERDGEYVGREQDYRDSGRHSGATPVKVGLSPISFRGLADEAARYPDFAGVRADLEALGYAVGAADLCAASTGAPHIRQRLFWGAARLADSSEQRRQQEQGGAPRDEGEDGRQQDSNYVVAGDGAGASGLAYSQRPAGEQGRLADEPGEGAGAQGAGPHAQPRRRGDAGGVAYAEHDGRWPDEQGRRPEGRASDGRTGAGAGGLGDTDGEGPQGRLIRRDGTYQCFARPDGVGPWSDFDLIECADGKVRRIPTLESGVFPVAYGVPARVGRIRAYGGAIVPQVAAEFIRAFMEAVDD